MTDTDDSGPSPRIAWALETLRSLHAHTLRSPRLREQRSEADERFLARFDRLLEGLATGSPDYEFEGREMMATLQLQYPELWEVLDRRLLWFFGGDCLHFLDDDEIELFQRADEAAAG